MKVSILTNGWAKSKPSDAWASYCKALRGKVNIEVIKEAIALGKLTVFVDVMHGAAASGLAKF